MTTTKNGRWLSPVNKLRFMNAFRTKAKSVVLDDGRKFNLTYDTKRNEVLVKPVVGLVPMGYFNLTKVTDDAWLDE